MIERVNSICLSLIYNSAFKEQIITTFECDNLLLLVWIYWSVIVVDRWKLISSSVPDHVVREV